MKPTRIDELRTLLLGPDHEKLQALQQRVARPEQRAQDVAEVLPDSVATSFQRSPRLIEALRTPLRQCVSESVREDPDEYADALFPVMGPAIRRAVAEAFKGWIQQANQVIEQSLSARGLAWRVQAWRAGIPYGQYVLQRTLLYRVEHVYLIHSSSGLLIEHVHQADALAKDEDAVSAMFTAIQDFVQDSFERPDSALRTAELGELTLWAVHGPSSTLVAVIRGVPPQTLRGELAEALEQIEAQHSAQLRAYAGERDTLAAAVRPRLQACLLVSMREPGASSRRRRFGPALVLLVVLVLLLAGWLGYQLWMQARVNRLAAELAESPGIAVTALERDGRAITVRGLRDPLAADVGAAAARAGWRGPVTTALRPYLSLEPELVLARAEAALNPPASVALNLDGSTLRITGEAPTPWLSAAAMATPPPGVTRIDLAGVTESADIRARQRRMTELAEAISAVSFSFEQGTQVLQTTQAQLDAIVTGFREHAALAETLGSKTTLAIIGNTDETGRRAFNIALELSRAEQVEAALVEAGLPPAAIRAVSQLQSGMQAPRGREVRLRLETAGGGGDGN